MRHLRSDYNAIQDTTGATNIADDEPVFVLRAQDLIAPEVVEQWAQETLRLGGDGHLCQLVVAWANEMREWQHRNIERVHVANTPAELLPEI